MVSSSYPHIPQIQCLRSGISRYSSRVIQLGGTSQSQMAQRPDLQVMRAWAKSCNKNQAVQWSMWIGYGQIAWWAMEHQKMPALPEEHIMYVLWALQVEDVADKSRFQSGRTSASTIQTNTQFSISRSKSRIQYRRRAIDLRATSSTIPYWTRHTWISLLTTIRGLPQAQYRQGSQVLQRALD